MNDTTPDSLGYTHAPSLTQAEQEGALRRSAKQLAAVIDQLLPV